MRRTQTPRVERLEDRTVLTLGASLAGPSGTVLTIVGNDLVSPLPPPPIIPATAVGVDAGASPLVKVYNPDGTQRFSFVAYNPFFAGGVHVATADVNGDGFEDIITGAGPGGGPHVKVFDGQTARELQSFFAYDPKFAGGVTVAAGDVNGDGRADIITGAGPGGGPHVKVFDGATGAELASFFAYVPNFAGGVTVAAGDVNGDRRADIITGAGPGGGPHVKVFDGRTFAEVSSFYAYAANFTGGVFVVAGDVTGNGRANVITGAGPGGGPQVKVFDGQTAAELRSFFAFGPGYTGGVRVASESLLGDTPAAIITGTGTGASAVKYFNLAPFAEFNTFSAFPGFNGGVFVG
jgi:hypothetical protein